MKIAWIVPGGVDRSGRERVIPVFLWLIEELATRHELHVFALRQYPNPCTYPLLGAMIHNLGDPSGLPGISLARQLSALYGGLRTNGPFDLLHGFWADGSGFLAAILGKILTIPTIITLAGGELVALPEIRYGSQIGWRNRLRVRLACHWAREVTAASWYMCDLALQLGIEALEIPLGVHPHWFNEDVSHPPGPPWRLLHVASVNRVKDQRTLLLAMKHLVTVEPQIHLDIIGEDTLNGEIQSLCRKLNLAQNITFCGFLPNEDTRPYFKKAHLLVMSSLHDAGPLVMLEAAACGVPTVGTDAVGHARDWHPEKALAVPAGDHRALAEAILTLLHDPNRRGAMGCAAQGWAQVHDSHWTAQQFERLYRK